MFVVVGRLFEWEGGGLCAPPFMRPLNAAFLGEEGCAAFAPTGKRAAFFFFFLNGSAS